MINFSKRVKINKHTVSIAEAIHVPYRPQRISKRHNSRKNTWKDTEVKIFLYYVIVNTNSYPKFDVNILQDDRKKCGKLIKVKLDLYYVKTNSYTKMSSQYYKTCTGKESPETNFLQREITQLKAGQTQQN